MTPGLPPGAIPPGRTRVLLALVRAVHNGEGPLSYQDVADDVGLSARSTVQQHIGRLVDEGLVVVVPGRQNTTRPTVRVVTYPLDPT